MEKIRLMTISDYDEIYKIWSMTPGLGLRRADDSREGIEKYLKRNPSTCFVAETDDKIIGGILSGHDGRRGYISHTVVLPEYRGHGVGTRLVKSALSALAAENINKVALVVFADNVDGNAFWEKLGFSPRHDLVYRNKIITDV